MANQFVTKLKASLFERVGDMTTNGMGFFPAAVLIPLIERQNKLSILFEVRASQLVWQPGEVCFPGGRVDEQDINTQATAIRETIEELGISREHISVIGEMGAVVSPIGVILKPHIGILHHEHYQLSEHEVAEVFTVPLEFLLTAEPLRAHMEMGNRPLDDFPFELVPNYSAEWKRRRTYEVLFYQYEGRVIWGLTAQVLAEFIELCRSIK